MGTQSIKGNCPIHIVAGLHFEGKENSSSGKNTHVLMLKTESERPCNPKRPGIRSIQIVPPEIKIYP